jgi:fluoroacetyl-CoA thioesterase
MDFEAALGCVGMASMSVRPGDTSVAMGINDLSVVSTTAILNVIESACSAAVIDLLELGETTQTSTLTLDILTTVTVGEDMRGHARCIGIDGDLLTFEAEVVHLNRTIATAEVQRRLVDRVSYMARIAAERLTS